jgi:hypothetical protein
VQQQEDVAVKVKLLEKAGPALGRPHADTLAKQSRHSNMKELRIVHRGDAYRVLFAFDPRRVAVLLLGGRKADQKWYKTAIPAAGQAVRGAPGPDEVRRIDLTKGLT